MVQGLMIQKSKISVASWLISLALMFFIPGCGGGSSDSQQAQDGLGESAFFGPPNPTSTPPPDTSPPTTPTGLSATSVSSTQVTLSWNASIDDFGVPTYKVFRDGTQVATVLSGTSYQDTYLTPNTTYTYTVGAYDQAGNSSVQMASLSVTTLVSPDTTSPSAPTNLVASGITTTSVTISWTASTDNVAVTGYDVIRNGTQVAVVTSGTSYQDTGLTPNTTYAYSVSAYDQAGNHSAQSASVIATTSSSPDTTPPSAPTNLVSSGITSTSMLISWSASTDNVGVTGYRVYRNGSQVATVTSGTSYQNTGLTPNTTYAYTVRAYDQAGNNSAQSASLNATTLPDTTSPSAPTNLTASGITSTSMLISWTASTDNVGVTGYRVYRNGTQVATVTSGTSYQNTGLTPSTTYAYTVSAYDQAGNNSAQSASLNATTLPDTTPPSAPTSLVSSGITLSTVTLSWTASSDNVGVTGYRVYRNGAPVATVTSGTSYQDTGLAPSTTYAYTVSAYDQAGNNSAQSSSLNATTLPDTTPPSAPTNLAASGITTTSVTLSWSASTDNVGVTGYRIYRNGTSVATVASGTSYQDINLIPATTYTYTVSAYDQAGNNSAQSASVNATTSTSPDTTPPSAPTNLAASGITTTSATISWTASTDNVGVIGYSVYRNGTQVATVTSGTSYQNTGLTPNTTYAYTVRAYDQAGNNSAQSSPLNVTTLPDTTPPSAPTSLVSSGITLSTVTLSWTASTDNVGVTGYRVYRNGTQVATVTSGTSYQDTGLAPNTTYAYTVSAYDQAGNNSAQSSSLNATTLPDTTSPSAPTNLAASGITTTSVTISWTASTDNVAVTGYSVYRNGTQVATVTSGTSYQNTGLTPNTTYAYTVSAYDQAGNNSAQSSPLNATTLPDTTTPSVPTNLAASAITTTSVTLSWTASTDNIGVTGYRVYRNGTQVATVTSGTSYPDTGLTSSTTYAYTISAYDQAGNNSAQSSSINATTLALPDTTPPSVPTNLVASGITADSMTLSWTASTDNVGVTGYTVYRNGTQVATVTSGTSYQDTGLTPNTTYAYTVSAYDQAGNSSAQLAPLNVTTLPPPDTTPPSAPTNLVASGITSTSMLISWSASTDNVGVTGYRVFRNGTQVATVTSGTSYQNTNLTPATAYTYTVQAYDQAGNNSAQSSPVSATTLPPPDTTPPSVPTNLVSSGISSTSVTISWSASTDNVGVVGYRVFRNGAQVAIVTPGISYQDTNLTPNTTYAYTVSAYDQAGNSSAQSAALNVTTTGTPPPPVYSVTLAWDAPTTNIDGSPLTNLAGYWLYYGTSSGVFTTNINVGNVTTYTISNLPYGTYYFAVKAYNTNNNFSDYSSPTYGLCVNVDATPSVCIY